MAEVGTCFKGGCSTSAPLRILQHEHAGSGIGYRRVVVLVDEVYTILESAAHDEPHDNLDESLMKALAIWIARGSAPARRSESVSRARFHYERFTKLLERHHRSGWSVADYASELGITPAHLNSICRDLGGTSALHIVHDRVLLAARRDLGYTDKSIAGVAATLGFSEPSYFTRFFKHDAEAYRRRSGTLAG